MRASRAIQALFPAVRTAILAALLLDPEREWYFRDLAKHLGLPPSSLTRELRDLTDAGILRRRRDGNRVYYRADPACPFLPELRGLLLKTAGLADVLRELLLPFRERITCAFIYGSIAQAREVSESDVDLMIIGQAGRFELTSAIRTAQERLARPVSVTLYKPDEFAIKASDNHFVRAVLNKQHLFVVGNEHDLDAARKSKTGRAGTRDQARDR